MTEPWGTDHGLGTLHSGAASLPITGSFDPLGAARLTAGVGRFGGLLSLGISWRRPRLGLTFLSPQRAATETDSTGGVETVQAVSSSDTDHVSRSVPATAVPRMDVGSGRFTPARPVSPFAAGEDTERPAETPSPDLQAARLPGSTTLSSKTHTPLSKTHRRPRRGTTATPSSVRRDDHTGQPAGVESPADADARARSASTVSTDRWRMVAESPPRRRTVGELSRQQRASSVRPRSPDRHPEETVQKSAESEPSAPPVPGRATPFDSRPTPARSDSFDPRLGPDRIRPPESGHDRREAALSVHTSRGGFTSGIEYRQLSGVEDRLSSSVDERRLFDPEAGRAVANTTTESRPSSGQRPRSAAGERARPSLDQQRRAWQPGDARSSRSRHSPSTRHDRGRSGASLPRASGDSTPSGVGRDSEPPTAAVSRSSSPATAGSVSTPRTVQSLSPVSEPRRRRRAPELVVRSPIGPGSAGPTATEKAVGVPDSAGAARTLSSGRSDGLRESGTFDRDGSAVHAPRGPQRPSPADRIHAPDRPAAAVETATERGGRSPPDARSSGSPTTTGFPSPSQGPNEQPLRSGRRSSVGAFAATAEASAVIVERLGRSASLGSPSEPGSQSAQSTRLETFDGDVQSQRRTRSAIPVPSVWQPREIRPGSTRIGIGESILSPSGRESPSVETPTAVAVPGRSGRQRDPEPAPVSPGRAAVATAGQSTRRGRGGRTTNPSATPLSSSRVGSSPRSEAAIPTLIGPAVGLSSPTVVVRPLGPGPGAPSTLGTGADHHAMGDVDTRGPALTPLARSRSRDVGRYDPSPLAEAAGAPVDASSPTAPPHRSLSTTASGASPVAATPATRSPAATAPHARSLEWNSSDVRGQTAGRRLAPSLTEPSERSSGGPGSRPRQVASHSAVDSATSAGRVARARALDTSAAVDSPSELLDRWSRPALRSVGPIQRRRPARGSNVTAPLSAPVRSGRAPRWSRARLPSHGVVDTAVGAGSAAEPRPTGSTAGRVVAPPIHVRSVRESRHSPSDAAILHADRTHAPVGPSPRSSDDDSGGVPSSQRWGAELAVASTGPDPLARVAGVAADSQPDDGGRPPVADESTTLGAAGPQLTTGTGPQLTTGTGSAPVTSSPHAADLVPTTGLPERAVTGHPIVRSPVRAHDRGQPGGVEGRLSASSPVVVDRSVGSSRSRPGAPRSVASIRPGRRSSRPAPPSNDPRPRVPSTPSLRYEVVTSQSVDGTTNSAVVAARQVEVRRHSNVAGPVVERSEPIGPPVRQQTDLRGGASSDRLIGRRLSPRTGGTATARPRIGNAEVRRSPIGASAPGLRSLSRVAGPAESDSRARDSDSGRLESVVPDGVARTLTAGAVEAGRHVTAPLAASWSRSTPSSWPVDEPQRRSTTTPVQDRPATPRLEPVRSSGVRSGSVRSMSPSVGTSNAAPGRAEARPVARASAGGTRQAVGALSDGTLRGRRSRAETPSRRPDSEPSTRRTDTVETATRRTDTDWIGMSARRAVSGASATGSTRGPFTASADRMGVIVDSGPVVSPDRAAGRGRSAAGRTSRGAARSAAPPEHGRSGAAVYPALAARSGGIAPGLTVSRLPETASERPPSGASIAGSGRGAEGRPPSSDSDPTPASAAVGSARDISRLSRAEEGPTRAVASTMSNARVANSGRRSRAVRMAAAGGTADRSGTHSNTINRKTNSSNIRTELGETMDSNVVTPSLTYHRDATSGGESAESVDQTGDPVSSRRRPSGTGAGGSQDRRSPGGSGPRPTGGRDAGGPDSGADSRSGPARRDASGGGAGTERPAPSPFDESRALESTKRIDPAESSPGDRADRGQRRQDRRRDPAVGGDLSVPDESGTLSMDADVDRVVDVLYRRLERKFRIERQRKGL